MKLREMIISIFENKKQKNTSYSIRALARDLHIDVGQLNRIINSKSTPSVVVALRVGRYLNLKSDDLLSLIEGTIERS